MQKFRRAVVAIFALTLALTPMFASSPVRAQAGIAVAGLSLRQVIDGFEELIKTIEQSASRLIEQGNNALAQQQMLAAGILRSTINQMRIAYKDSLDLTFDKIAATHANLAGDIDRLVEQFKDLKDKTIVSLNESIYKAQGAANQIISRLPLTKREPVVYGMIVRDIFSELPKVGYDLEILGFNFRDPKLNNKNPTLSIDGNFIPPQNISIQDDRLHIVLPDEIKNKVGYRDNFCSPRPRFAIHVEVFYRQESGPFWPFKWSSEGALRSSLFGLANAELFNARVNYSAQRSYSENKAEPFRVRSQWTGVGCEASNQGNLSYRVPDNASQVNCQAAWVDQSGLKAQTATCAVGGSTITATGSISGRDRNCFVSDILTFGIFRRVVGRRTSCNCPGGGHATFELSGTYVVPESKTEIITDRSAGSFRFDDRVDGTIPGGPNNQITKVDVEIRRDRCEAVFDRIILQPPAERTLAVDQSSENGNFNFQMRTERFAIIKKD